MRQWIANLVCALTLALVIALAALFAARHNRVPGATPTPAAPLKSTVTTAPDQPDRFARGRTVFSEQGCAMCHALAGEGNPRLPLDDVGSRRSPEEIRAWITATGSALAELPGGIAKRKARYQSLAPDDLDALVQLLARGTASQPAATKS